MATRSCGAGRAGQEGAGAADFGGVGPGSDPNTGTTANLPEAVRWRTGGYGTRGAFRLPLRGWGPVLDAAAEEHPEQPLTVGNSGPRTKE